MAATSGAVDRYDGDPDQAYLEDIQQYMDRTFKGWDFQPQRHNFLQSGAPSLIYDYQKKFPFSIQRLDEKCFTRNESNRTYARPGAVSYFNTPTTSRPQVYGGQVVADAKTQSASDPRQSQEELRLAKVCFRLEKF